MPITPAHAAAAWPLRAWMRRLPLSALIVGTMSPDYEYLLTLAPITRFAHTLRGLALFCVPVSLAVWFVFRRLVRPAIVDLLPPGAARAIGRASASWGLALAAVVLGAVSHVIWDGFTHHSDWGVNLLPILRSQPIPQIVALPWYKLLQVRKLGGRRSRPRSLDRDVAALSAGWRARIRTGPAEADGVRRRFNSSGQHRRRTCRRLVGTPIELARRSRPRRGRRDGRRGTRGAGVCDCCGRPAIARSLIARLRAGAIVRPPWLRASAAWRRVVVSP